MFQAKPWSLKLFLGTVLVFLPYTLNADVTCSDEDNLQTGTTDVLFLVDSSSSMCPYSQAVSHGMSDFVTQLMKSGVDAQFAVATFGGAPTLLQKFSVFLPLSSHNNVNLV